MAGHVLDLPEESKDQTEYSKTIDKLKEHTKTAHKETYLDIASIFTELMTQAIAWQPAPMHEDATDDDNKIRKKKVYAKKTDAMEQNLIALYSIIWGQAISPRSSQSSPMVATTDQSNHNTH